MVSSKNEIAERVGTRMRVLRLLRGLTHRDVGETIGLTGDTARTSIARHEAGTVVPSLARLCAIARAIGVNPGELIDPDG